MSAPTETTGCVCETAAHTEAVTDDDARSTDVVVPDDISGLARDIAAYRKEVRRAQRAARRRRMLARRGVMPLLVITGATLLAGVVAVLLSVMAPRTVGHPPAPAPLAAPAQKPGTIGGLLPAGTLRTEDGTAVDTHSPTLRPEVFALIPTHCSCAGLLNELAGQAYSENVRLAIVVPAATDDTAVTLATSLDRGLPSIYYDQSATVASAVASQGITVLLVDRDGTIYDIDRDVTDPTQTTLNAALQTMLLGDRH